MAYTTINKSTDYFNTKLWSGNGSSQALTGIGHQTDMVWIKSRTDTRKHNLYDVVRGVQKRIVPNDTAAEDTVPGVTAFGTDGFTVGSETDTNGSSRNFVGWSWSAGASAGSSNTDGSQSSTVSVNTTAGFSIVKFTNTTSYSSNTFGHGLGVAPQMIIMRSLDDAYNWDVYHHKVGATKRMVLNSSAAEATTTYMNNTAPTNQVFTLKSDHYGNGSDAIAYCFAEKKGYSKFGSYTGNGNSDGTFVYTGFKPAWVMIKNQTSGSYKSWSIFDNTRQTFNPNVNKTLYANRNEPEGRRGDGSTSSTIPAIDMLSNGFKCRVDNDEVNTTNDYIYMAFGQTIVGTNNIPATAR